ncbi:hypothetical protein ABKN59_007276 [Abortiporus biennis]
MRLTKRPTMFGRRWQAATSRSYRQFATSRRALTEASASTSSATSPPPLDPYTPLPSASSLPSSSAPTTRSSRNTGTIHIKPWDGVHSMPEAFAIVRAVERKFGKIRDFKLGRDLDSPGLYQPFFYAEFDDHSNINRLESSQVIKVKVPVFSRATPGDVGLEDLAPYLDSVDIVEDSSPYVGVDLEKTEMKEEKGMKVIDVRVERTRGTINYPYEEEYPHMGKSRIRTVGQSFIKWGGFYNPATSPQELYSDSVDGNEVTDTTPQGFPLVRMRKAQNAWQNVLKTPKSQEQEQEIEQEEQQVEVDVATAAQDTFVVADLTASESTSTSSPVSVEIETPAAESVPSHQPEVGATSSAPVGPPKLSRRERLLELARQTSKTPLPASVLPPSQKEIEEKEAEERRVEEEKEKERQSVKDRLMKLMGRWM